MAAIINGLRALGSGGVLEEVFTLVLDSALECHRAERGFVMLADEQQPKLEITRRAAGGNRPLSGTSFSQRENSLATSSPPGNSRIVGDLLDGNLAGDAPRHHRDGNCHVVCVPLSVGAAGAGRTGPQRRDWRFVSGRSGARDAALACDARPLDAFATQAALAIDSARLYADSAEEARIDRDLRVAAEIQRALLPEPNYVGPLFDWRRRRCRAGRSVATSSTTSR